MQMADRRWMYLDNRTCGEYLSGLKSFFSAAEADKLNRRMSALCCPCIDCDNVRKFSSSMHAPLLPACSAFPSCPLHRAPPSSPLSLSPLASTAVTLPASEDPGDDHGEDDDPATSGPVMTT